MDATADERHGLTHNFGIGRRGFSVSSLASTLAMARSARAAPTPVVSLPVVVPLAVSEAVDAASLAPVMALIEQGANLRWQRNAVPFARLLRMVEQGDAIGFGVSPTEDRSEAMRFSRPLFRGAVWAVSRRDRGLHADRVEDLRGRVVCVSRTAEYGSALADPATYGLDARQIVGDLKQRVRTLEAGRCDALLVTSRSASLESLLARLRSAGADLQALQTSKVPLIQQDVHFAVAKDSPLAAYMPSIDAAIEAHRGDIARIVNAVER